MSYCDLEVVPTAADDRDVPYASDLSDEQWALLEPLLVTRHKRGPRFGADLRRVVDGMLYIAHTGCQWRFLPAEFGPWTRIWSQFRRWLRNGTWAIVLAELHAQARVALGRTEAKPSMVVIDTHLARGASNGGATFHRRGGPYGHTNGAKRIVAVDVCGLPLASRVVPASTSEPETVDLLLTDLRARGQKERLELVLIDRGTSKRGAERLSFPEGSSSCGGRSRSRRLLPPRGRRRRGGPLRLLEGGERTARR